MAKVVLIVDSGTGRLIDMAGNGREGGRYAKFAKRMLSLDQNPVLDYGANGGDTLVVSRSGGRGAEIKLDASTVNVTGDLKVSGKTLAEIIDDRPAPISGRIFGTENQIGVSESMVTDPDTGARTPIVQISLDNSVIGQLAMISAALGRLSGYVGKEDLAEVVDGLSVESDDTLDDVKATLGMLIERIAALAGQANASGSGG